MAIAKKGVLFFLILVSLFTVFYACKSTKSSTTSMPKGPKPHVLVFIKTASFYHNSIPDGVAAIQKLGRENGFDVDSTRDAMYFNDDSLKKYSAVVFLSTTGNVLNADQQVAFERYLQAGGGYVGIHAAADCEYDWPWYNKLVGAYFASHPAQQKAVIDVVDSTHPATSFLPRRWERFDEWYNYRNINPDIHVLLMLDETTYQGGINGDNHPIAWYHGYDGGRAFYTGLGHTKESYNEPLFLKHLLGGIQYAIGGNKPLDYSKSYAVKHPEDNRFTKTILSNDLNEPMELAVAPDGRVFFTERAGKFYVYDPTIKKTKLLYNFPVKAVDKYLNGLIGVTLDPDFKQNNYIYFFYTSNTGEQYHQNVSRFKIAPDGNLDTASEKIIIKIPIDLEVSAHTGGSLAWDRYKNLYISTGDNTTPFESDGYAPIDERPGRKVFDAQRSAGNPNDLRGKILRIHPEPDGSYTIPEGNLFQKSMPGTRPEIYVMGCRNPYRMSVDTATSIVYWGEVGPDAGEDSRHGPRGYDEFNQAKKAGNFGWPYFVGKSFAYHDSDFATKEIGPLFDVAGPTNNSPNNTGMKQLPPPNNPMVWYPYARSEEFPDLEEGGRCAMGGPVYHYDPTLQSSTKFPAYYDKALFVYDWMRNWVFAFHLDSDNNFKRMERFMQTNGDFRRPIDMEFGPDGSLYVLEYGSVYGIDNVDARLVRIDYNGGNRPPVAKAAAADTVGLAPLTVKFNSKNSYDFDDEEALSYQWSFGDGSTSNDPNPTFSFTHNGLYKTVLTVTDKAGAQSHDTVTIYVGNTLPSVAIQTTTNSSFFFPKSTALDYNVAVSDKEDERIDPKNLLVSLKYIPRIAEAQNVAGHQQVDENYNFGKTLVASSDCKACHQLNAKSVGPSFTAVAKKYRGDPTAIGILANKIITGGSGVWGEHAMSAHPQLSKDDAMEIVKYVLSVSDKKEQERLPQQGTVVLNQHLDKPDRGRYIFTASYTDAGGAGTPPLTRKATLYLQPAKVQVENVEKVYNMERGDETLGRIHNGSYFMLPDVDLKDITGLTYRYSSLNKNGRIAVRMDSLHGQVISTLDFAPTGNWDNFKEASTNISDPGGKHNLYFVFVKLDTPNKHLASLDWVRFDGGKEVTEKAQAAAPRIRPSEGTDGMSVKEKASKAGANKRATATKANPVLVLIAKSDCRTCHKQNATLVGPSFVQIAARYRNKSGAASMLADKVIQGGAGHWGKVPMTPHPALSKKDATQIVQYILSLKK